MSYQTVSEGIAALSYVGSTKADIIAFVRQLSLLAQADIATSGY